MRTKLFLPGAVLALVGIALSAQFTFSGPELPSTVLGVFGWGLLLGGFLLLRLGASR